jgi:SAM-dependent methyltransferase
MTPFQVTDLKRQFPEKGVWTMHELIPKQMFHTGWEQYWSSFQESPAKVFWNADPAEAAQDVAVFEEYFLATLPVVDAGCGNGTHTRALANHWHFSQVIGTDVASAAIASAPARNGSGITYRTLDLLRPEEAARLHREIGDANVHIRGVLHQLPRDYRDTAAMSISELLGNTGTLYLKELSPAAEEYLAKLIDRFGPVEGLERVMGVLVKAGIRWGSFAETDVDTLFPPERFALLAKGDSRIQTTNRLPTGEVIVIPAIYAVLRRRKQVI